MKKDLKRGDILKWAGRMYEHWAVYVGNGRVIHYAGEGSSISTQKLNARIVESRLSESDINKCSVWNGGYYNRDEVVRRARSRVGEKGYSVIWNNCESFAKWCVSGIPYSSQVLTVIKAMVIVPAAILYSKEHV